jgi:hypothetical protein
MYDLQIAPTVAQVFGEQASVTMLRLVFTAEQAGAVD